MSAFAVERMTKNDQPAVVAALARAFFADPLFDFFVPNRERQMRMLLRFMKSGVVDARPFGEAWVARPRRRRGRRRGVASAGRVPPREAARATPARRPDAEHAGDGACAASEGCAC